jgi:hypothetical protein
MQFKEQSQSKLRVLWDAKVIKAPKVPVFGFNLTVSRPLTLVPIKRVMGVPLASEITELMAQPQRVNN